MNAKENFLEAIYFKNPEYIPMENEEIIHEFSFDNIVRKENWTDCWGVEWKIELEGTVPFPKGNPISDIRKIGDYIFPSPNELMLSEHNKYLLSQVDRSQKLVFGHMSYLLFERAWALTGMENLMIALIDFPEECRFLLHNIASYAKRIFARYIELGADGITFSEDLGSQKALMISPEFFREFLLPEYKFIFEDIVKEKKIINFHSCGSVDTISADLSSIGITMLNPIQARANDLQKIKTETIGKTALKGGIDTDLLLRGTPESVKKETIRVIEILKPGGGYVCAPDQHFPYFPARNVEIMWETAIHYGRY